MLPIGTNSSKLDFTCRALRDKRQAASQCARHEAARPTPVHHHHHSSDHTAADCFTPAWGGST